MNWWAELLQVTRVEADPSMQKTDTVHLDELLADLVYDSLLEAKAKDCTLLLKAPVSAIVSGDEELIRRALENVIRNAIRYAPRDTAVDIELTKLPRCRDCQRSRLRPRRSRRGADAESSIRSTAWIRIATARAAAWAWAWRSRGVRCNCTKASSPRRMRIRACW